MMRDTWYKLLVTLVVFHLLTAAALGAEPLSASPSSSLEEQAASLQRRLDQLEPAKPEKMLELPGDREAAAYYPTDTIPAAHVIADGKRIPFRVIQNDPLYQRPVYEEHWHSTYWGGRWSCIPARIHHALHRLFATYDIGLSHVMSFTTDVGVDFPIFQDETDLDLYLVVFQTKVCAVYTKGNQVVVVGAPARYGVQTLTVKTGDLRPSNTDKWLLVQLVTPTGDEVDYTHISYVEPDFWEKQIRKAKERGLRGRE
ncbi:hypothetical protein [Paenibacillus methanolicus]|nr:hypothetical protein [Paenibacillus methanolicus]